MVDILRNIKLPSITLIQLVVLISSRQVSTSVRWTADVHPHIFMAYVLNKSFIRQVKQHSGYFCCFIACSQVSRATVDAITTSDGGLLMTNDRKDNTRNFLRLEPQHDQHLPGQLIPSKLLGVDQETVFYMEKC